uniref:Uncharacterized protein n=1 Tax=Oryza nivara TaxID=4536 RepID=A0A0E0IJA8_ORYNI
MAHGVTTVPGHAHHSCPGGPAVVDGFVNAHLFSSGFPYPKKLHLKNRHSKDLALLVDALLLAAATMIMELVVE